MGYCKMKGACKWGLPKFFFWGGPQGVGDPKIQAWGGVPRRGIFWRTPNFAVKFGVLWGDPSRFKGPYFRGEPPQILGGHSLFHRDSPILVDLQLQLRVTGGGGGVQG